MSGSAVRLPTTVVKIGTSLMRACIATSAGLPPAFQSPSPNSTIARRSGSSRSAANGPAMSVAGIVTSSSPSGTSAALDSGPPMTS
jgi:hypothetical protein